MGGFYERDKDRAVRFYFSGGGGIYVLCGVPKRAVWVDASVGSGGQRLELGKPILGNRAKSGCTVESKQVLAGWAQRPADQGDVFG
jgi:hypothetical protein